MSASRNSKKEVSSHNTEVLQDMTRRAKEFYDSLNRETNRVCKQVEARDGPGKKLEQNPSPKILKLNVGGHIFLTSLATLHNAPSGNFTEEVTLSILNVYLQLKSGTVCCLTLDRTSITVAPLSL